MARARNIKPSFFKNEDLAELKPHARLLFIGLWCLADREGLLEDRPKRIKAELFPYEDIDVDSLLQDLHKKGFIYRYSVDGKGYISIVKFSQHQNPHHREAKSTIPKPNYESDERQSEPNRKGEPSKSPGLSGEESTSMVDKPRESRADSLNLIPDSLIPDTLLPQHEHEPDSVVVIGGKKLKIFSSVIDQYKYYFAFEPNLTITELLHSYLDDGVQMDMLAWAMRDAAEKGKDWRYAKGTIENLFSRGIRTAQQAELSTQEFKQQVQQKKKVVPLTDKLPASVQRQLERERQEAESKPSSTEPPKTVMDDPELRALLESYKNAN